LLQKGLREPLLCAPCEQILNIRYEQTISRSWATLIPREVATEMVRIDVPDRSAFELFHLSILWRANLARGHEWSSVSLGGKHSEILRNGLLQGQLPKGADYPIFATMVLEDRVPSVGWVGTPSVAKYENARVYSTLYGGCMWSIVVASHAPIAPDNPFRLSAAGRLVAPAWPLAEMPRLNLIPLLKASAEDERPGT
jgi:hypothetical protein